MDDMEKEFLNNINRNRQGGFSFFDKDKLNALYNGVVNKTFRVNENAAQNKPKPKIPGNGGKMSDNKANTVIQADKQVRAAVQNLVISLSELGDKEIAQRLIGEHILMLNEFFKEFE
jgi:hypothetical protein